MEFCSFLALFATATFTPIEPATNVVNIIANANIGFAPIPNADIAYTAIPNAENLIIPVFAKFATYPKALKTTFPFQLLNFVY